MTELNLPGTLISLILIAIILAGGMLLIPVFVDVGGVDDVSIDEDTIENIQENLDEFTEEASESLFVENIGTAIVGLLIAAMAIFAGYLLLSSRPSKTNILLGAGFVGGGVIILVITIATVFAA